MKKRTWIVSVVVEDITSEEDEFVNQLELVDSITRILNSNMNEQLEAVEVTAEEQ